MLFGFIAAGSVSSGLLGQGATGHTLAAAATPPAPPTDIPTPIGPPPAPPAPTPTATVPPTATPIASTTAGVSTTPALTPTTAVAAGLDFSLDAARVSKANNPGNLQGLAAIRPGSTVWLMQYYTVRSLPKSMKRTSTYEILYAGRIIYKVVYDGAATPSDVGRFSRYTPFTASRSLPYGQYVFRAILTFGKASKTKSWKFGVGPSERVEQTSHSH